MIYTVVIKRSAEREVKSLPTDAARRIGARLLALANDPRPPQAIRLKGSTDYRIRIGDYRVVYSIEDDQLVVSIIAIGHRREIYRDL